MKLSTPLAAFGLVLAVGTAQSAPVLSFLIDGNTFTQPFSISNSSTGGEFVTRFQLDLTPVSMIFDTATGGPPGNGTIGVPFTPVGGDAALTGLVAGPGPVDGASLLDIAFTGFDPGETFRWDIDVDGASGSPITVTGDMLIGALATIDFSDGQRLLGVLSAVAGDPDASQFVVTGITVTPSVPLPGTMALAGLALAALVVVRRGKQRG